jgi:hypothetical protein
MVTLEFSVPRYFHPPIEYSLIYADSSVTYNFTDSVENECSFPMRTFAMNLILGLMKGKLQAIAELLGYRDDRQVTLKLN